MGDEQPDILIIDAFDDRTVLFEDGLTGRITNWFDPKGVSHDEPVVDTVAIVARHPGDLEAPWYACALGSDEWHPDFPYV